MGFHEALSDRTLPRSRQVFITVPPYRGMTFVPVLGWLAGRVGTPDAEVNWQVDKQQGPRSIARLLTSIGWRLARRRSGRKTLLTGPLPSHRQRPNPRRFDAKLDGVELRLEADYGVFSPERLDAGTQLLFDVAKTSGSAETLCDVGTGYGPLAIGLVATGIAARAVATEVDSIAVWLARRNARAHGVDLSVVWSPDPLAVPSTPLTVCNVPTHINADQTHRLIAGLAARGGRLLIVVHASLGDRYSRLVAQTGRRVRGHQGDSHVVLDADY